MAGLNSGQQLSGRYALRGRLSAGPLGETWRAHDATLDREVVIRVLPPQAGDDPAALERVQAELEAARDMDPGVFVAARGVERDGAYVYLVRDFIPGTDLTSLRAGSWRAIASAAASVAEALASLHRSGLVHRDVKPGNVILRPDSATALIDFGNVALEGANASGAAVSRYSASPQQLAGEPAAAADDAYGLGAVLYELLSGYPPFYPNFTRERALHEPVAPLKPAQPAPQALIDLTMSLLAKSAADRPGDLAKVGHQLRELAERTADSTVVGASRASTGASATPVVTIVRPILRQGASADRKVPAQGPQRRWMISAAFAVLVLLAISVFVLLPNFVRKPAAPVSAPATATNTPAPKPAAEPAEPDLRSLAEQMQEAEQVRDQYDSLYESLEKRAVAEWAPQPFAAGRQHGEAARKHYAAREFKASKESYQAGLTELHKAADLAEPTLRAQIEKGEAALVAGQSAAAQAAFNLALKIEPGNAAATKGLKRAGTLDQVNALLASAAGEERTGQLPLAVQHYDEALKLDPDTTAARDGAARVRARISGDQFSAAMAQGLAQLSAGKLATARSAFERARALRPNAPEVADALAQVSQAELHNSVDGHRLLAERYEHSERWSDALAEYDAALKLDPGLEFARAGHDRTTPRAEMARQLDTLVKQPERLLAPAVRDQTRALLAAANKVDPQGQVLRQQIATVSASIAQFEQPVRVALESDNQTQVVIHRVGQLGMFDHREIDLQPGTYTVMGTRVGYRDVRREFTVMPGKAIPPLIVRCEDRI
jgi:eukaryotic-like serine/threonine-protein kinase